MPAYLIQHPSNRQKTDKMSQDNKNSDETATATMAEKTTDIFTSREQEIMLNALLCMKEAPSVSLFPLFDSSGSFFCLGPRR